MDFEKTEEIEQAKEMVFQAVIELSLIEDMIYVKDTVSEDNNGGEVFAGILEEAKKNFYKTAGSAMVSVFGWGSDSEHKREAFFNKEIAPKLSKAHLISTKIRELKQVGFSISQLESTIEEAESEIEKIDKHKSSLTEQKELFEQHLNALRGLDVPESGISKILSQLLSPDDTY